MISTLVVALALAVDPAIPVMQDSTVRRATPMGLGSCRACPLYLNRIAVLGKADDPELIPDLSTSVRLVDGRVVVGNQRGGTLQLYAPDGKFLTSFGRDGDGPGEFRSVNGLLAGPGDSVVVMGNDRVSVIDVRSGKGRSGAMPANMPTGIVRLSSGELVVNGHLGRRLAFTVLHPDLRLLREFGPGMQMDTDGQVDEPYYPMTASRLGGFWAAKAAYVHRIERYSATGAVVQRLDSLPSWFPRYTPAEANPPIAREAGGFTRMFTQRPLPATNSIHEDAQGRLWVISTVADPKWRPVRNVPPLRTYQEYQAYSPPADPDRHVDTVVEAYDAKDGSLIGAWRLHNFRLAFHGDGLVRHQVQDEAGINRIEVWNFFIAGSR